MSRPVPVVVTGTGAVSALGGDVEATWHGILDGRTAVRHWPDLAAEGHALDVACRVDDSVWGDDVPRARVRGRALARRAAREALEDAGLLGPDGRLTDAVDPGRVGVFVGTTMGESGVYEESGTTGEFDLGEGGSQVFAESVAVALRPRGTPSDTRNGLCGRQLRHRRSRARRGLGPGRHRAGGWGRALLADRDGRLRPDAGDGTRRLRTLRARPPRHDARRRRRVRRAAASGRHLGGPGRRWAASA